MKENRRQKVGFNGSGLIKPIQQKYREAEMRIGELERQNEWLKQRVAYLLVAIQAAGKKFNQSPDEMKAITNAFIAEQQKAEQEEMKKQFMQDIADGKTSFKIIDRTNTPDGTGTTQA